MKEIVDEYPYNCEPKRHSGNSLEKIESYLKNFWGREAVVLGSARTGIYQLLNFFQFSRTNHILVPDFLCQSILNILNTASFPVKYLDERTKAVLVFHQWGYPQKMSEVLAKAKERNLIVIEDCAHSFDSEYQGRKIGTFGQAAVFSWSKVFNSYLGGVLISQNNEIINYCRRFKKERDKVSNKIFNKIAFKITKKSFEQGRQRHWLDLIYLASIKYPNFSQKSLKFLPADIGELKKVLSKRKKNYLFLKHNIKKEYLIADWDDEIEVNPMLLPVFLNQSVINQASAALAEKKIQTSIMHFDVNRNVFNSDYRKCLAVPCHQQLEQDELSIIVNIINQI